MGKLIMHGKKNLVIMLLDSSEANFILEVIFQGKPHSYDCLVRLIQNLKTKIKLIQVKFPIRQKIIANSFKSSSANGGI
jgi:hypothetical protein